jgi:SAM-dependent methyltransferase
MTCATAVGDNSEQESAWNGDQGETWLRFEPEFNAAIAAYGDALLIAAGIRSGERVLDVGCGMGATTRRAAQDSGSGRVVGIDISRPMIRRAEEQAARAGLSNVEFIASDAQVHPFDRASVDVVISRFGTMFFGAPAAGFANIRNAVRPGGRLAIVTWRPLAENEWLLEMRRTAAQGRDLPEPVSGEPGPFGLSDPVFVRTVLESAGWDKIAIEGISFPYVAGEDADHAFAFQSQQSVTRGLLAELDDAARDRALAELRQSIERHQTPRGVIYQSAAWLTTARA